MTVKFRRVLFNVNMLGNLRNAGKVWKMAPRAGLT